MNWLNWKPLAFTSILGCSILLSPTPANAWQYARDAVGDSLDLSGGRSFDIFGMGIHDDGQNIFVGISANLPLTGYQTGPQVCDSEGCYAVSNSNIGWGDLFFDFSGNREFGTSNDNRQLYGVRFAPGNDSGVGLGVYRNVQGTGVAQYNAGYRNLGRHYNSLPTRDQQLRTNVGDLAWNDPYWGGDPRFTAGRYTYSLNKESMPNVIGHGERIGDVSLLDRSALLGLGFDGGLGGSQLFGFQFSRSLLPNGNFIATLLEECLNDAIALRGVLTFTPPPVTPVIPQPITPPTIVPPIVPPTQSTPEPSIVAGIAGLSALLLRKSRQVV